MKNKNFLQSLICAFHGLKKGFRSERNFKIYIAISLTFLIFNILLSVGVYDYLIWFVLSCFTFATEYINTAIERVCDHMCSENHEDIAFIKDVAAAAVLVSGFAFFIGEGLVIIPRLL